MSSAASNAAVKRNRSKEEGAEESLKKSKSLLTKENDLGHLNGHEKNNSFSIDVHNLKYINGFGGTFQSEAIPNTLPIHQNTPQKVNHGLYAELLSGTSFTTPRCSNQRSWLYRIRPTACHKPFKRIEVPKSDKLTCESPVSPLLLSDFSQCVPTPNQIRWRPLPIPSTENKKSKTEGIEGAGGSIDFIQGIISIAGAGNADSKNGLGIHLYTCNTSMKNKGFVNSDGDLLIIPQEGEILIRSEFGYLHVPPTHIAVIQRGITFSVEVTGPSRGYICELYSGHFKLPELGPIGSNGLANVRDFEISVASFEDRVGDFEIVQKYLGGFWHTVRDASPYDVVGWHGNYAPFKYDLKAFCPAGAVLFDHMDPSIFTVLTAPSAEAGVAICDFVIFPPRYAVQEHTFRPPYYHRNVMSEYMGNIKGKYEAKEEGFLPGGGSLHSIMVGHGPDAEAFKLNSNIELKPQRLPDDSLSFMFESTLPYRVTEWALREQIVDADYYKCWAALPRAFKPENSNEN